MGLGQKGQMDLANCRLLDLADYLPEVDSGGYYPGAGSEVDLMASDWVGFPVGLETGWELELCPCCWSCCFRSCHC